MKPAALTMPTSNMAMVMVMVVVVVMMRTMAKKPLAWSMLFVPLLSSSDIASSSTRLAKRIWSQGLLIDVPPCNDQSSLAYDDDDDDDDDENGVADDDDHGGVEGHSSRRCGSSFFPTPALAFRSVFFIMSTTIIIIIAAEVPQLHLISLVRADCSAVFVFNRTSYNMSRCMQLSAQSATLAWTYHSSNASVDLVFSGTAPGSSGWVGWGINPTRRNRMVGTSALIAFDSSVNGSNVLPYKLTSRVRNSRDPCACSAIEFVVTTTAVEISGTSISFLVSFKLPSNSTSLNHIWGRGSAVRNFQPQIHGLSSSDLSAYKVIDMDTAAVSSPQGGQGPSDQILKSAHGILSTMAWGILFPLGVIFARYIRPIFDSAWFYFHISCQTLAYAIGVTGWALGMKLRTVTAEIDTSHRNIGIALFAFTSLQMFALLLRPQKDKKIRKYWNAYHHVFGYVIIGMGVLNVIKGINISAPGDFWRYGYIASLCLLVITALILEFVAWLRHSRQRN